MKDDTFQPMTTEELLEFSDSPLSTFKRIVLFLCMLPLAAIFINAGWSYVLLVTGNVEGGGCDEAIMGTQRAEDVPQKLNDLFLRILGVHD